MSSAAGARKADVTPEVPPENPPAPVRSNLFPKGIPFIVGNEGAERFSFYGMRAILYVYMTALFLTFQDQGLLPAETVANAKAHALQINHLFIAGVYAFPMI